MGLTEAQREAVEASRAAAVARREGKRPAVQEAPPAPKVPRVGGFRVDTGGGAAALAGRAHGGRR